MQISRRNILTGVASSAVLASITSVRAQDAVRSDEKADYARVYGVGTVSDRELAMLSDLQAAAAPTPKTLDALAQHFKEMATPYRVADVQGTYQFWHQVAMDLTAFDHATNDPPKKIYAEQLGPTRSSRAMAIVHLAMFEAVNLVFKKYESYQGLDEKILENAGYTATDITETTTSFKRAVHEAASMSLRFLYPLKTAAIEEAASRWLIEIRDNAEMQKRGRDIGVAAANMLWIARQLDGSANGDIESPLPDKMKPLVWGRDPITELKPALGSSWHLVRPFVINSGMDYLPPKPPMPGEEEFDRAYAEVKGVGGDRNADDAPPRAKTPSTRKGELTDTLDDNNETFKAIFWAYDGTAFLCAPPRPYNQIAFSVAANEVKINDTTALARYMAVINLVLADAGIAAWTAKYHYAYARPVTTIRTVDEATMPLWTPLGAPVTNGKANQRNLTPPFPAYPSGHAVFGAALFHAMTLLLRQVEGAPSIPDEGLAFDFKSDEFNGQYYSPGGPERGDQSRHFPDFKTAAEENGQSRVWLGIHWEFDKVHGIKQGIDVAGDVVPFVLKPRSS